ncbi:Protein LONGIFOLIA like [Actinidia chinensis var. chinensis]|uniref:Protein LONGIFOLIA like n=1 Tax=Actinidia chinensis var. chinensis TaxID=1590841 RepID=A0A2R6PWV7_ACTCC|nr:Protein LONGIFOLIA like [Actinidia chinensis var. chinensis]
MERIRQKKPKVASAIEGNRPIPSQRRLSKMASDASSYSSRTTDDDLFTCELGRSSSRRTPIKKLLAEEMSKETQSKRQTPSVIARLMGLDGLPLQQPLHSQHKGLSETYQQRNALVASQREGKPYDCRLSRNNSMEQQEFKDVYEILETSKIERGRYPAKDTINSKLSEAEMAFIQQKFMDAKRLSTDEKLHNSKEFCDTLNMLDTNKDLLMKFFQQPDSLFTKHLLDLRSAAPKTQCSRIAISKPSDSEKYESNNISWKSERETLRRDTISPRKHHDGLSIRSYNYHRAQKAIKSSKIQLDGKYETDILPMRIVVLKPNLENVQHTIKSVSSACSSRSNVSDCRKHKEYPTIGAGEAGSWIQKKLPDDGSVLRPKSRESRESAKEVTRRMRESFRGEPINLSSIFKGYAGDESSCNASESDSGSESDVTMQTSRKSFHWSNRPKLSPLHSIESSVSREAKTRLSERWKMSQRYPDVEAVGKGSTLGEMLAISDWEIWPENLGPLIGLEGSSDRFVSNDETAEWDSPLGISSREGWKDGRVRTSSRLRSVPASPVGCSGSKTSMRCETLDPDSYLMPVEAVNQCKSKAIKGNFITREVSSSRKSRSVNNASRSSRLTYRDRTDYLEEKQFNPSQIEIKLGEKDPYEQNSLVFEIPANNVNSKSSIADAEVDTGHKDIDILSESPDELLLKPSAFYLGDSNSYGPGPENSKAQEPQIGLSEEDSVLLQHPVPEPQSPESTKDADHPSPVSVLDVPFTEDVSSGSECFERVSADLNELRMQLKLLKMESGAYADEGILSSSDKDVCQGFVAVSEDKGIFKDEESLETSYLVDVLIYSGFDNASPNMFMSIWHSPDCPLDPSVFENLEKKYSNDPTWLRFERRLLFDRINCGLVEIFRHFTDLYPWMKPVTRSVGPKQKHEVKFELRELLASEERNASEGVTQAVLDREMQWLGFEDEIEAIGREIENFLISDLVVEAATM